MIRGIVTDKNLIPLELISLEGVEPHFRSSLSVHELVQTKNGSGVALPGERVVLIGGDVGVGEAVFGLVEMVFGGGAFGGGDGAAEGQLVGEVEAV